MKINKKRIMIEKRIFQTMNNPFIVKLHYSFQTVDNFYFILDLVNGGELGSYMVKKFQLKEKDVKFYATEILYALK